MKDKVLVAGLIIVLLLSAACSSGVSKDEYEALVNKYDAMKADYSALQTENKALKTRTEALQRDLDRYKSNLNTANAYAAFLDVYIDTFRWVAGQLTKYGYKGIDNDPNYLSKLEAAAKETKDDTLFEKLDQSLSLPNGIDRDKAWSSWHVRTVERLQELTKP
jgi:hypothetical protein